MHENEQRGQRSMEFRPRGAFTIQTTNQDAELASHLNRLYTAVCERISTRRTVDGQAFNVEVNLPYKRFEGAAGPGVTQSQFERIADALTRRLAKAFPVLHDLVQVSGAFGVHRYTVCFGCWQQSVCY